MRGSTTSSSSSFDVSKLEIGDFQPKRARFAAFKSLALKPVSVKKAKIVSVYTPRVTDALTTGRAYVYFFPLGQTEPAIVVISDPKETSFYSLVVHPITGRVRIYNEEVRPPVSRDQVDDEGNRITR
jgi:general secretion pathway protein H